MRLIDGAGRDDDRGAGMRSRRSTGSGPRTRNGSTPWNYARFLDHATDRILLRKVGGGYTFIHRMLLEYFAARYVEPGASQRQNSEPSPRGGES
jgi:hypothetical protein